MPFEELRGVPADLMYTYEADVVRIIDGDTVVLNVDCGFFLRYEHSFRLLAVNAPEIVGAQKADGLRWKAALESLIPPGSHVLIRTTKADKYGRWLVSIEKDEISINHHLVEKMANDKAWGAPPAEITVTDNR